MRCLCCKCITYPKSEILSNNDLLHNRSCIILFAQLLAKSANIMQSVGASFFSATDCSVRPSSPTKLLRISVVWSFRTFSLRIKHQYGMRDVYWQLQIITTSSERKHLPVATVPESSLTQKTKRPKSSFLWRNNTLFAKISSWENS